jgi:hypothetical protein
VKVNPFQNLYLRAIGKADGKDYVLIQRLGEERPLRFIGNDPGDDQISVKTVKVGNNFRETKVTLQKGSETGEIGFKEDSLSAPPAAAKGMPGAPGQVARPTAPGAQPPQFNAPRPQSGAVPPPIPRPSSAVPPSGAPPTSPPTQPAPGTNPNISRQRVRVIGN